MKENMNINLTDKHYIDYLRYKDNKNRIPKNIRQALAYFTASLFGIAIIAGLLYDLTYTAPAPMHISYSTIIKIMLICVGFGWMFHGVGFFLMRGS